MGKFGSVNEVLDFAIRGEEEAAEFYTGLAAKMQNAEMRRVFEGFAGEERGHKAKLEKVKQGKRLAGSESRVVDLKIADYLVDVEPSPEMDYRDALILAMQKEKAAFKLYTDLAAAAEAAEIRDLFLSLAQEEAKHKLRFELEYDKDVLKWN